MSRVVSDTVRLLDQDGVELRSFVFNSDGESIENARFLVTYLKKNIDELIYNVCIYRALASYLFNENINIDLPGYEEKVNLINQLGKRLEEKYPNKYKKIDNYVSLCNFVHAYSVTVTDSFIENKIYVITFILSATVEDDIIERLPIIPELAHKIYVKALYGTNCDKIEDIIIHLCVGKIYFSKLYEETNDEKFSKMEEEIDQRLYEYEVQYPDEYEFVKSKLTYTVVEQESKCNNIELFAPYFIDKLINLKMVKELTELESILLRSDTDNPDYDLIVEQLSLFIQNCSENDESECFNDMVQRYDSLFIITIFTSYYYTSVSTEKYKNLFKDDEGNQRTHD